MTKDMRGRSVDDERGARVEGGRGWNGRWLSGVHRPLVVLHEGNKADDNEVDEIDASG